MKKFLITIILCLTFVIPANVTANENTAVTRLSAVHMLTQILPQYEVGVPFDDTWDLTAAYYRKMGIVSAIEGNSFMPDEPVMTQDFLLMLKRALDVACPDLFYNNQNIKWHYDQNEIYPYAQNQLAMLSAVGIYNNSGFLHPKSIISEGMASYYINLAIHTMNYGKRSKNGVMPRKKPQILMYHLIEEPREPYAYLYVSSENFEAQIKYLYDNGYTFLFPEELSMADNLSRSVVITFDDGYNCLYKNALPILKKYNAKATVYVVADMIGTDYYCTQEELREMSDSNAFRVYSHTKTHPYLTDISNSELEEEFRESNIMIYNITKREVTSIAYPYGYYDDEVISIAKKFYKNAMTVDAKGGNSIYDLRRTTIDNTLDINSFARRVK
ncbi:MAG: polysaccharide deacetylase family protein [Monoglobaceae bacterium]